MGYSLNQAARETGKSKSTIENALSNGTISGKKVQYGKSERWDIDPAELHRVYLRISDGMDAKPSDLGHMDVHNVLRIKELEGELAAERQRADAEGRRADTAETDRDAWRNQAQTLLLAPPPKRGFWRWLITLGQAPGDQPQQQKVLSS